MTTALSLKGLPVGQKIAIRCIRWIIKERMRAAGFDSERLTAHSLRHTAITLSLLAGA
jgi:integrase